MKDELPGNFKQQQEQPKAGDDDGDDDEKEEMVKDEATPTEQDGDGTVKSAAAAALASAAIKAKVGVLRRVLYSQLVYKMLVYGRWWAFYNFYSGCIPCLVLCHFCSPNSFH